MLCLSGFELHSFFLYKNLFYKNVESEIDPNFKNVLRTFLRLRVDKSFAACTACELFWRFRHKI